MKIVTPYTCYVVFFYAFRKMKNHRAGNPRNGGLSNIAGTNN